MGNSTGQVPPRGKDCELAGATAHAASWRTESKELLTQTIELQHILAKHVSRAEIDAQLRSCVREDPEAGPFTETLLKCADVLAKGVGGMIVSVVHEDLLEQPLNFHYLDGGLHTRCFRDVCKKLGDQNFAIMLDLLTAHNETDRWEIDELKQLCSRIPEAEAYKAQLLGQPKDGAITFSHSGSVKGGAMHLKYSSSKFQLRKPNGSAAGTRHAAALGLAEHLCTRIRPGFFPGVVFARSDGGGAHVFIPTAEGRPLVLHFDTLKIPSQEDMLRYFKGVIMAKGRLLRKETPVIARHATFGEQVISVVDGKVTCTRQINDYTSYVIRANTPDQELYALKREVFKNNYEDEGIDLAVHENIDGMPCWTRNSTEQLITKGFKLYFPRTDNCRWAYEVTEEDMTHIPTGCFLSSWEPPGRLPLRIGDILGMPAPESKATEIYWMPRHALSLYTECTLEQLGLA